jgi:hypothetical protein
VNRSKIDTVLKAMAAACRYYGSEVVGTDFTVEMHPLGSADALMSILERSERWTKVKAIRAERDAESSVRDAD